MAVQFTLEEYPLYDEAFAKGFAVGYAKGQTKFLLRAIERRLGSIPDHVPARILAGSTEDRDRWSDAIIDTDNLTAADLDAILNLQPS